MPQHHDTGYKKLYTFPKMVEDLLVGFVHQDWISELDFTTLEKLNNSYVTDEFRERSDDIIWWVRFRKRWLIGQSKNSLMPALLSWRHGARKFSMWIV